MNTQYQLEGQRREKGRENHKYSYLNYEEQAKGKRNQLQKMYFQEYERHKVQMDGCNIQGSESSPPKSKNQLSNQDNLIEAIRHQNNQLKFQLSLSRQQTQHLRQELAHSKQTIFSLEQILSNTQSQQLKNKQFVLEELGQLLGKNKIIDSELQTLNGFFLQKQKNKRNQKVQQRMVEPCGEKQQKENYGGSPPQKILHFLNSVEQMHEKITGKHTSNLQTIWRWLKDIAQIYSHFKRWRSKVTQILNTNSPRPQSLLFLLQQAVCL